jgi:hypothetical protein
MGPKSLSFWHRLQYHLLLGLAGGLATFDSLLRVDWGQRLLDRVARRWQLRLDDLDETLARLEEERGQIENQARALAIQAAAIYLGGRSLAQGELRFDPADAQDEELLDATIDLLVKERLVAIEPEEIRPGHYIYHLEPDWPAIGQRLAAAAEQAEPETADWLRQGWTFIDETFCQGASAQ